MSTNADTRPSLGESIDAGAAGLPFYAPPLQADVLSPEEFDKEFDKLDIDRYFQQYCLSLLDATRPTTWVPTPSTLTWSQQSSYKPTPSRRSPDFTLSDCLRAADGLSVHDSIRSDVVPNAAQSFGFLPPSLYHAGTQSDNGACGSTDRHQPVFEMSPLSVALQQSITSVTPTPVPTQSTLGPQTNTPTVKPFRCHFCGLSSKRRSNLKEHLRIHSEDPKESKRFVCTTCNHRFTRRHDLRRHGTIHGDHMPSSSVPSKPRTRRKPSSTRHHPRDLVWLSSVAPPNSGSIAGVLDHYS